MYAEESHDGCEITSITAVFDCDRGQSPQKTATATGEVRNGSEDVDIIPTALASIPPRPIVNPSTRLFGYEAIVSNPLCP